MENLPQEITSNILSRLHFKQTRKYRCVCKLWRIILSHPTFPTTHLAQLSKLSPDILLHFKAVSPLFGSRIYYLEDDETILKRPIYPLTLADEHFLADSFNDHYPYILGSCNGFICLFSPIVELNGGDPVFLIPRNPIYVFNPITRNYSKFPLFDIPEFHTRGWSDLRRDKWFSGFGYVDSKMEYKLVLVVFTGGNSLPQVFDNQVLVYTLGSTTWRKKVGIAPDVLRKSNEEIASPAFVNGSLHWITVNKSSSKQGPCIVFFNLDAEEFGFVPTFKSHLGKETYRYRPYQLGIFEQYLSVVECSYNSYISIWVMKKYNVKESWVKQFSIKQGSAWCSCQTAKLIKVRNNGDLLLLIDNSYMVSYNTITGKRRLIQVAWEGKHRRYILKAQTLVGSLISLKSAFGMDAETTTSMKRKR
ncbi:hypothetical protein IFM89_019676 [Coptis chinensis]|uniref:F-box domain-containing protein n=1 Tax=Coptis chinensis TaxID=261450 RepID=A0A835LMT0_9MAGN|nr:hypothetical protein IFM89_019676 [Coptis chinensis]